MFNSAIIDALFQLEGWENNTFIDYISSTFVGLGGIMVASGFLFRNEFPIYAGISFALMGFGKAYFEIFQRLRAGDFLSGQSSPIFIALFLGPLVLAWLVILVEFMRGRD